jgi:hypothetical protein
LLFAAWWILDMGFVWVSPRSYEQYYLPLNASAAMLSGYFIAAFRDKIQSSLYKPQRILVGVIGIVLMIIMSQHIFFGVGSSAHSGVKYPEKRNGYVQRLKDASGHRKGARGGWEVAGDYMKNHSTPDDGIYVWGWFPGIYIAAQRLSPAPKAFEGTMHTLAPKVLSERVEELLNAFKKKPPKFLVDTHKQHFPWDRPPLELWPTEQGKFIPAEKNAIESYENRQSKYLRERVEPDEELRFDAMKPLRDFVMENYNIIQVFGQHVLFQHK